MYSTTLLKWSKVFTCSFLSKGYGDDSVGKGFLSMQEDLSLDPQNLGNAWDGRVSVIPLLLRWAEWHRHENLKVHLPTNLTFAAVNNRWVCLQQGERFSFNIHIHSAV